MNPNQKRTASEEGFTLIELLIVMSVILILMTLALPQYAKIHKSADETSALSSIKAISQGQKQYSSAYPASGYSCSLPQLGGSPGTPPSAQAAQVIPQDLASGSKSGYLFNLTNCTKVTVNNQDQFTGYEITAVPSSIGKSGDRGYCMDENDVIKFDPAGGTNCTQNQ